jgi:two-component system, LytTR family, response regulator
MNVIIIPGVRKNIAARTEEIIRVEAADNYCWVYFKGGKMISVAKMLCWFQHKLPEDIFVRVHLSHLVNKLFVKEVNVGLTNLLLNSGELITVSRRKKACVQTIGNACAMVA